MNPADCRFYAGVDGGGTRCRVRLRGADGTELAFTEGGSANVHFDPEGALKTIQATLDHAFMEAGLADADKADTGLGLGLAGIVSLDDSARVQTSLAGYRHIKAESDAAAACLGAHAGTDGGLVIAGTGSAGFAIVKGTMTGIGGRGFSIGDEGSAARIGWEALRQSVLAADDLAPTTKMTLHMMKRFESDPAAVTRWTATARPADYGALAPIVFLHAEKGDAAALPIIKKAVAAILNLRAALQRLGADRIALVGGLAEPLTPWIDLSAKDPFVQPLHDAADGAILLAGGKLR
jgi:glucosamine kinase